MSVENINIVDGLSVSNDNMGCILLITDHLEWQDEYGHMCLLQEKINSYVSFIESGQHKEVLSNNDLRYSIIQIRFLYKIPQNCRLFLESVKKQLNPIGVDLEYIVTGDAQ